MHRLLVFRCSIHRQACNCIATRAKHNEAIQLKPGSSVDVSQQWLEDAHSLYSSQRGVDEDKFGGLSIIGFDSRHHEDTKIISSTENFVPVYETIPLTREVSLKDAIESLMSAEYDVSGLVADVCDLESEDAYGVALSHVETHKILVDDAEPSTSQDVPPIRRFISDKLRQTLSSKRKIPSKPVHQGIKSVSAVPEMQIFEINPNRSDTADVQEILDASKASSIEELRQILSEKRWPRLQPREIHFVLNEIVQKARNYEEAHVFFKDFITTSRMIWISDWVAIRLVTRAVSEASSNLVAVANSALNLHRTIFLCRPPPDFQSTEEFVNFISFLASKIEAKECLSVMENARLQGYPVDNKRCVEAIFKATSKQPFNYYLENWKTVADYFAASYGYHTILERTLSEDRYLETTRCLDVLNRVLSHGEHPLDAIAEVVTALVIKSRDREAAEILAKITFSGRQMKIPMKRLLILENGLDIFERLCYLLTENVFAERFRYGKKKEQVEKLGPLQDSTFVNAICEFAGVKTLKAPSYKQKKPKKIKVDEDQLSDLSLFIQFQWLKFMEKSNDLTVENRMRKWSQKTRIDYAPEVLKKLREIKDGTKLRTPKKHEY